VTLPNQGANAILAMVTDSYGNTSRSAAVVVTLDDIAPTVALTSTSEASNVGIQTITGTVTSGGVATVIGQTVTLTDNGTALATATVASDGTFTTSVTLPNQGTNSIVATVTDSYGNTGGSAAVVDTFDSNAPTVTVSDTAETSNVAVQTITGTVASAVMAAVIGQTVTLTDNGVTLGAATVQSDGTFTANVTLPNQGTNSIVAIITDSFGNTGSSAAVVDTLDNVAPTVTITSAAEASKTAAQIVTGTVASGGTAVVVGQTVILKDNGVTLGTATVQSNGTFSANVTLLNQGANSIVGTASDSYGNVGSSAAVVDTLGSVPPTITGTRAGQTTTSQAPIDPFTGVTISDLNVGATDALTITLSGAGGTLSGLGLSGSGSTYSLSGTTASAIASELDSLVFTPTPGQPNTSGTTTFTLSDASTGYATTPVYAGTPTVLASFNGTDGQGPQGGAIADAAGDLFGTTLEGGAKADGTVFEITKTGSGYSSTPTVLVSFSGPNGNSPESGVIMDAAGDLFGTTYAGGANGGTNGYGTVFEITKTGGTYSNTSTVLASFNSTNGKNPYDALIMDAAGDLFGTTIEGGAYGGTSGYGTVFEITKSGGSYSSTPTVLASFNGTDGQYPAGSLIMDATGDLFGTAQSGGAHSDGTVFEIVKSGSSYSGTPTVLASFSGTHAADSYGSLIMDTAGDLFGTTYYGGANGGTNGYGTVFEITKTGGIYNSTPTVLASFNASNGEAPLGSLIMDSSGDLLGTTLAGGANGDGVVFEIAKTGSGYSSAPTVLASFNDTDGEDPVNLIVDAAGDLLGTTVAGGANNDGTVFELPFGSPFAITPTVDSTTTVINTDPPVPPVVTITTAAEVVSVATQTITGTVTSADATVAGQMVTLTDNGLTLGTTTVASNGSFSVNVTLPNQGANPIVASVTDSLGRTGSSAAVVDTLRAPTTITGTRAGQTTTSQAPVDPFSGVTLGDPNAGATDTLTIGLSGTGGTLSGTGLSGAGNVYTLSGTTSTITSDLDALVFTPTVGQPNTNNTTTFKLSDASTAFPAYASTPTVLDAFNGTNGKQPMGNLIADAAGDLFGTTDSGGANNDGSVFEIIKSGSSYSSTPTVLASFNGTNGVAPSGGLIMDAAGDLFGTTSSGGANSDGIVFEIAKSGSSYSSTPTTIATFGGTSNGSDPVSNLIMDAAGDLFGTAETGGSLSGGVVFEIAKSGGNYSSAPTVLATLGGSYGINPRSGLIMDSAGNLFGTTSTGGPNAHGSVVEIVKNGSTYNSTPTVLVAFNNTDGGSPVGNLIMDSAGDLFGTTSGGGASNDGEVFEIVKSGSTYSSTTTILTTFNGTNGNEPMGGLVMDSAGNLYGSTQLGGANGEGTLFELAKSGSGYSTATVLTSFNNSNGNAPVANLFIDAAGNLVGTTDTGGTNNDGEVFELSSNDTVDSTTTVINIDPPVSPTVTFTSAAEASKTAAQIITGTASSPDATIVGKIVTLSDNGAALGTATVASNGTFSTSVTLPNQGTNSIVASVTDSLGLTGNSAAEVDTLDSIAPSLTIGSAPVPGITTAQTISGTVASGGTATVSGRTVTLTDNGSALGTATVQSNGSFSTSVTLPGQANNAILESVSDSYGNTNNSYLATTGSGQISITATQGVGTANDLDFTGSLTDQNLWFLQSGNNLQIDILGSSTGVTVNNWFSSSSPDQLQEISTGGLKIDNQVSQLVQAMATYSSNNSGFNPTASGTGMPTDSGLQSAIAAAWHA
jgi:hypothetical protein